MIKNKEDIIQILKDEKKLLNDQFGVLSIGLFGSYAKGAQNSESDIDLMVELKEPRYEFLAGLQIYLEQKFEKKIELIRKRKNFSDSFVKSIEKNIIYV
ncbi:MAG TPA: toxin-antitoxin system toxin subunit [Desulfobacter sp.]|jgi:predicted nucleotidyltransferase|nr:toxin-antitoxin system toxin subunit [Desulfobacter sp.]